MDNFLHLAYGVAGYIKAEAYRPSDGRRRTLAPWTKNLITNNGMEKLANNTGLGEFHSALRVGSGSTAPTNTDTTLTAHVASAYRSSQVDANADTGSPTPYTKNTAVFTFGIGAAAGNITEYGLAGDVSLGGSYPLYTHGLFRDSGGTPVTIIVAADEQLIVTYEVRVYIPTTVSTAVVTNASTGVDYTMSILPCRVGAETGTYYMLSQGMGMGGSVTWEVYYGAASGTIGTIGTVPSGTLAGHGQTTTTATYVPGSYQKDFTMTFGLAQAVRADIGGFASPTGSGSYTSPIRWQITISPKITKTADQTLAFSVRLSLARA